jgi:hypothetical protein
MKIPPLLATIVVLSGLSSLHAQVISNFGNTATKFGTWTYTSGTSVLSGTETGGDSLFGAPLFTSINAASQLRLTANASVAPAGVFTITLEDNTGKTATAQFIWSEFVGGSTQTEPFYAVSPGFSYANLVGWSLESGGSSQPINTSLTQLSAVVVPEPSTYALGAGLLLGLCIVRREVRKRRIA